MTENSIRGERGFTLVEMAIVLVIIGLVLGAVVKGKDVLKSAQQKKFYTFVKEWELVVTSYYDRTGGLLSDGRVNGGGMDTTDGNSDDMFLGSNSIRNVLRSVGLTPVVSNLSNNGDYSYTGAYSGTQIISLVIRYFQSERENKKYNVLYFLNIPTDLAIAVDTMIDGQADGRSGAMRQAPDTGNWPDASAEAQATINAFYILDLP